MQTGAGATKDKGGPRPAHTAGRSLSLAAVLAATVLLLGVVALSTGRRGDGTARVDRDVLDLGLTGLSVVAAVLVTLCVVLAIAYFRLSAPERRLSSPVRTVAMIGFMMILATLLASNVHLGGALGGGATPRELPPRQAPERAPDQVAPPHVSWQFPLGAAVLTLVIAALLLARRDRSATEIQTDEEPDVVEALTEMVDGSLDDLKSEPDPRRAIIAAYARMEGVLARHGVPRRPEETPLEYLVRVLVMLEVRGSAVHALTDLFERAKFSDHPIDGAMKREAINALEAIRADLRRAA